MSIICQRPKAMKSEVISQDLTPLEKKYSFLVVVHT